MQKTTFFTLAMCAMLGVFMRPQATMCSGLPLQSTAGSVSGEKMATTTSAFYCNLGALRPEQRKRIVELVKTARSSMLDYREISNGIEMRFPANSEMIQTVAEWTTLERLCCPFFDFDLHVERDGGAFLFRLTGSEGVKQFIQSEFHFVDDHRGPGK